MNTFLVTLHIIAGGSLILIVLLQTGKGAAMGAAFGGSSQTVFGSAGAGGFLGKLTTGIAILFMVTSLSLATLSSRQTSSSIVTDLETLSETPAENETPSPTEEKKQDETK
jgi:preprotein translocase subunit SecG